MRSTNKLKMFGFDILFFTEWVLLLMFVSLSFSKHNFFKQKRKSNEWITGNMKKKKRKIPFWIRSSIWRSVLFDVPLPYKSHLIPVRRHTTWFFFFFLLNDCIPTFSAAYTDHTMDRYFACKAIERERR